MAAQDAQLRSWADGGPCKGAVMSDMVMVGAKSESDTTIVQQH